MSSLNEYDYGFDERKICSKIGNFFGLIIAAVILWIGFNSLMALTLGRPQAFTVDCGETISYIELPILSYSGNGPERVYPGDKRYEKIKKSGDFDLVNLPPTREVMKEMKRVENETRKKPKRIK